MDAFSYVLISGSSECLSGLQIFSPISPLGSVSLKALIILLLSRLYKSSDTFQDKEKRSLYFEMMGQRYDVTLWVRVSMLSQ